MPDSTFDIASADEPVTIPPGIFGHFIEFLGRCINDGIWAGDNPEIPQEDGLRLDIMESLRAIRTPAFRWPGGTFADCYHWQDGIGPRSGRPVRRNLFWGGDEPNHFGTDEFLRWCRHIGAEPVLQTNLGSGSPQETLDWMDYCNGTSQSEFARLRRENGQDAPYGVNYWSIGNETGLQYSPEEYAHEVRRFGFYVRQAQPDARVIVCGDSSVDWNPRLMAAIGDRLELVDLLSLHCYAHSLPADRNDPIDNYRLLAKAAIVDGKIARAVEAVDHHTAGRKKIDVVIDEWGVRHHEARALPGFPILHVPDNMEQPGTLRDALFAARILHGFMRRADRIAMANISMSVNKGHSLLNTRGKALVHTPTYHVFEMLAGQSGAHLMNITGDGGTIEFENSGDAAPLPRLDAAASRSPDGRSVIVSIVNLHMERGETVRLRVPTDPGRGPPTATARVLRARAPLETNDFEEPERIVPQTAKVERRDDGWMLTCDPFSLAVVVFESA
jgi:alpha-N-arabinofuranosidase